MDTGRAVYFHRDDYAGFWRRMLVDLIDLFVAFTVLVLFIAAWVTVVPGSARLFFVPALSALMAGYFVLLKRSAIRTLGYRIGRVRTIGVNGRAASHYALTVRLLSGVLGPFYWLLDWTWIAGDSNRQALRDKLTDTYVVKMRAEPAGTGRLVYHHYEILLYNFLFREVELPKEKYAGPGEPPLQTIGSAERTTC